MAMLTNIFARVNGIDFDLVGNSAEFKDGFAEQDMIVTDTGNFIPTSDISTAKAEIKFDIHATDENAEKARQVATGTTKVALIKIDSEFTRTMNKGVCKNGETMSTGNDGKLTMTFIGSKLV